MNYNGREYSGDHAGVMQRTPKYTLLPPRSFTSSAIEKLSEPKRIAHIDAKRAKDVNGQGARKKGGLATGTSVG